MKEKRAISKHEHKSDKGCFQDGRDLRWFVDIDDRTKAKTRMTG